MPVVSSKTRLRAGALLVASVAVLFTAACGGGSDDSSTSGTSSEQGGGTSAFASYVSCLNENGVTITMPSGGPGGGMGNGGTRPSGAPDGVRPSGGAGFPDGAGLPSGQPRPSGSAGQRGGGGFPGGGGMFQQPEGVDDATWEKAQSACASLRPSMGAGRGNGNGQGNGADAAYTNCLKENGVTDTADLDESDATVKKAVETCKVLKPAS
ncbi:hypothetical protein ACTI_72210 [Actinoplanes sp. OR16]|uniref:hypothetical protein n=1 Tax=Actinoplanes sp. OR16 TaxID=946334 RepID=UPI000F6F26AC|nr:hypothetical protein [Actinoplanes sp. OR16]BBH70536.1 hypothetical protein ACTI_72210 [Actinoplanes sp. OR16]